MTSRHLLLSTLLVAVAGCGDDTAATSSATSPATDAGAQQDSSEPDEGDADSDLTTDGGLNDADPPDAPDTSTGPAPHKVGVTYLSTPVEGAAGRTLEAAIWYPAAAEAEGDPHVYIGFLPNDAILDAPIATGGPWPLVVFSHGNSGVKEQSVFLTEALAQAGYIVAAVDHTGNTFFDNTGDLDNVMNHMRPLDMSALIDRISAPLTDDPDWLSDRVDLEKVAILGHSRGGYTALAAVGADLDTFNGYNDFCADDSEHPICARFPPSEHPVDLSDPRIDAAVAMSPARYSVTSDGLASVTAPTMIITGKRDQLTRFSLMVKPIYDLLPAPKLLWTLEDGGHYTFTDLCRVYNLLPPAQQEIFGDDCDEGGPLSLEDAHAWTITAAIAWLNSTLKAAPEDPALAPQQGEQVAVEREDLP